MRIQLVPRHGDMAKVKYFERRLFESCPLPISAVQVPEHSRDVLLVMYGAGSVERTAMLRAHRQAGGHVVCFDRGYFGRSASPELEHYRIAIDELHVKPQHLQATPDDPSRFRTYGIQLREDYQENGFILVVGLGRKSRKGLGLVDWEQKQLATARVRFPGRRVTYRPKSQGPRKRPDGVIWGSVSRMPAIEDALKGCSLVITRHSNVAVDACIAGVPVELEDGAARWLYQATTTPSLERRASFLNRLSWWNWRANEMGSAWKFLLPMVQ